MVIICRAVCAVTGIGSLDQQRFLLPLFMTEAGTTVGGPAVTHPVHTGCTVRPQSERSADLSPTAERNAAGNVDDP